MLYQATHSAYAPSESPDPSHKPEVFSDSLSSNSLQDLSLNATTLTFPGQPHLEREITATEEIQVVPKRRINLRDVPTEEGKSLKFRTKKPTCWFVSQRIQSSLDHNKNAVKRRRCVCCSLAKNELATNNQFFNLCAKTSPL